MKQLLKLTLLLLLSLLFTNIYAQPQNFFLTQKNYYGIFSVSDVQKLNSAFTVKNNQSQLPEKIQKYQNKADNYYKMSNLPLTDKKIKRYKKLTYKYDLKVAQFKLPLLNDYITANNTIKGLYAKYLDTVKVKDTCLLNGLKKLTQNYVDSANKSKSLVSDNDVERVYNLQNYYNFDNKTLLYLEYQIAALINDSSIVKIFKPKFCKELPKIPAYVYKPENDSFLFVTSAPRIDQVIKYAPSEQFSVNQHMKDGTNANDLLRKSYLVSDTANLLNEQIDTMFDAFARLELINKRNSLNTKYVQMKETALTQYFLTNRNYYLCRDSHVMDYQTMDSAFYKQYNVRYNIANAAAYYRDGQSLYDSINSNPKYNIYDNYLKANDQMLTALQYQENIYRLLFRVDTLTINPENKIDVKIPLLQTDANANKQKADTTKKVVNNKNKNANANKNKTVDKNKTQQQSNSNLATVTALYQYSCDKPKPVLSSTNQTVYRIYVGQSKYLLPTNELKDYGTIYYETIKGSESKNFYVGNYSSNNDASGDFTALKSKGYPAKIVKFDGSKHYEISNVSNNNSRTQNQQTNNGDAINIHSTKYLLYVVQIGTFSATKTSKDLNGLKTLYFRTLNDGRTQYFVGPYYKFTDALEKQASVRQLGYSDADVVAFDNGTQITIDKAKKIEQNVSHVEQITFRIQVGAFSNNLTTEAINQKFGKLKDYKLYTHTKDNLVVYSVGNTTDYTEAKSIQQKVQSLGYKDCFIIAFKGDKQVPLSSIFK